MDELWSALAFPTLVDDFAMPNKEPAETEESDKEIELVESSCG